MKRSDDLPKPRSVVIMCAVLIALASIPCLTGARAITTSVRIVNNSSRLIRNVYTSPVDSDDWSSDVLNDATISAGQSYDVNNLACDGQQIKVIAEDQDGCFESTVVTCGQASTWTITNDTTRDCGAGQAH